MTRNFYLSWLLALTILGLSAPKNFNVVSCNNELNLSWNQIPEQVHGYILSYRPKESQNWESCKLTKSHLSGFTKSTVTEEKDNRIGKGKANQQICEYFFLFLDYLIWSNKFLIFLISFSMKVIIFRRNSLSVNIQYGGCDNCCEITHTNGIQEFGTQKLLNFRWI